MTSVTYLGQTRLLRMAVKPLAFGLYVGNFDFIYL